jgi:hypothetical protein
MYSSLASASPASCTWNLTRRRSTNMGEKSLIYGPGPSRKPDSALSRHPSPGETEHAPSVPPGSLGEPRLPCPEIRTNLACSHRWFTWPVPRGIPPVGSYPTLSPITCDRVSPIHRLVCSLLHLTWRRACACTALAVAAPRVLSPSGLYYESGLCSAPRKDPGHSGGSDGPDPR